MNVRILAPSLLPESSLTAEKAGQLKLKDVPLYLISLYVDKSFCFTLFFSTMSTRDIEIWPFGNDRNVPTAVTVSSLLVVTSASVTRTLTTDRGVPIRMTPVDSVGSQTPTKPQTAIESTFGPVSTVIMMPSGARTQSILASMFGQYETMVSTEQAAKCGTTATTPGITTTSMTAGPVISERRYFWEESISFYVATCVDWCACYSKWVVLRIAIDTKTAWLYWTIEQQYISQLIWVTLHMHVYVDQTHSRPYIWKYSRSCKLDSNWNLLLYVLLI